MTHLHHSYGAIGDRGPVDGSYEDAAGNKWTQLVDDAVNNVHDVNKRPCHETQHKVTLA